MCYSIVKSHNHGALRIRSYIIGTCNAIANTIYFIFTSTIFYLIERAINRRKIPSHRPLLISFNNGSGSSYCLVLPVRLRAVTNNNALAGRIGSMIPNNNTATHYSIFMSISIALFCLFFWG